MIYKVHTLYRHAVKAVGSIASTAEEPNIIKEHVFVISDDPGQDHDSVHNRSTTIWNTLWLRGCQDARIY